MEYSCWMMHFVSGPGRLSSARIDVLEALRFHTKEQASASADWLAEKQDTFVHVYQKEMSESEVSAVLGKRRSNCGTIHHVHNWIDNRSK